MVHQFIISGVVDMKGGADAVGWNRSPEAIRQISVRLIHTSGVLVCMCVYVFTMMVHWSVSYARFWVARSMANGYVPENVMKMR